MHKINPEIIASDNILAEWANYKLYMTLPKFIKDHITDKVIKNNSERNSLYLSINNSKVTNPKNWQGLQVIIYKGYFDEKFILKTLDHEQRERLNNIKGILAEYKAEKDFGSYKHNFLKQIVLEDYFLFNAMNADYNITNYNLLSNVVVFNGKKDIFQPYYVVAEIVTDPNKYTNCFYVAYVEDKDIVVFNYSHKGKLSLAEQQAFVNAVLGARIVKN